MAQEDADVGIVCAILEMDSDSAAVLGAHKQGNQKDENVLNLVELGF